MSREAILSKIDRANQVRSLAEIKAQANALIAEPDTYRPSFSAQSDYDRFVTKATSETVTASVDSIERLDELPNAVSAYLQEHGIKLQIALQPRESLIALDWANIETKASAEMNEPLAVTFADAGIAETGSLVFFSASDAPVLLNFLPLHHLAVVRRSSILPHMEDFFDLFGVEASDQKRSCNIITGTSGTADIEAKNVRGAHGPRFMQIYCVNE